MHQRDLFQPDEPDDLFDGQIAPRGFAADPETVRQEFHRLLNRMKASASLPWPQSETRYHQTVFPQMARWLPDDEAAQLCFDFETELQRLLAA